MVIHLLVVRVNAWWQGYLKPAESLRLSRISRKFFKSIGMAPHELIIVTDDTCINAHSFCDLLWRISRLNIRVPITLVWELAESLDIELLYIPPYSPNLNLVERLWKFVKKQCLYSKYYSEFKGFKNAIIDWLDQTNTTYREELDSLLALRFQRFEKAQVVAV